ncbi:lymphocyte antigen 6 family member pge [Trichomycterus rosablanca]|uniref:lymphocyte antigen 6 family member pge n=1 Tax=Trichomycterus rosablanca TaxID=2290929 RepID=UPI002F35C043
MRAVQYCLLLGLLFVLLSAHSEALQCYTCIGSTDEDCNRQESKACPSYSDACAVIKGQGSGVVKSCSYRSFCNQANSQSYSASGVTVHCCYSDNCNVTGRGKRMDTGLIYVLVLLTAGLMLSLSYQV